MAHHPPSIVTTVQKKKSREETNRSVQFFVSDRYRVHRSCHRRDQAKKHFCIPLRIVVVHFKHRRILMEISFHRRTMQGWILNKFNWIMTWEQTHRIMPNRSHERWTQKKVLTKWYKCSLKVSTVHPHLKEENFDWSMRMSLWDARLRVIIHHRSKCNCVEWGGPSAIHCNCPVFDRSKKSRYTHIWLLLSRCLGGVLEIGYGTTPTCHSRNNWRKWTGSIRLLILHPRMTWVCCFILAAWFDWWFK